MLKKKTALFGLLLGVAAVARGDDLDSNPYVVLYKNRVEMAKVSVERQRAVATYEQARYERVKRVYASNAASIEELQEAQSRSEVATMTVRDLQLRVAESENILNVTRVRIAAGQDMPICSPYESGHE